MLKDFLKRIVRFIMIFMGIIIGLFVLLFAWEEVSMISPSFIDQELNRMGLYEDIPDFPSYRIRGFWHSWSRSRYDYTLKLNNPISPAMIERIDSLCNTYEGHQRWHFDTDKGQYMMFLWDIAKDYNDFLIITPGKNNLFFNHFHVFRLKRTTICFLDQYMARNYSMNDNKKTIKESKEG